MSLISNDDPMAILALAVVIAASGVWIEKTRFGPYLPSVITVLLGACLLSTFKIAPNEGPVQNMAVKLIVPIAIPLLLFRANLRAVFRSAGGLVPAFVIATLATAIAAFAAYPLIRGLPEAVAFAGTNAAGLFGGSINFVAVSEALHLSPTAFATASAAFVVFQAPYLMALQLIAQSSFLHSRFGQTTSREMPSAPAEVVHKDVAAGIFSCLALACIIAWAGGAVAKAIGYPEYSLLVITLLSLIVANVAPGFFKSFKGEDQLGFYLLLVYFALIGFSADATALLGIAGPFTAYVAATIALHTVLLLGIGFVFRTPLLSLLLASNATIGGPATATAFAQSQGRVEMVTPAVLVGMLGYATATFSGLALARGLSPW